MGYSSEEDIEARKRAEWNRKIARMKKEKERALRRRRLLMKAGIPVIVILIIIIILIALFTSSKKKEKFDNEIAEEKILDVFPEIEEEEIVSEDMHTGIDEVIDIDPNDINPSEMNLYTDKKYKYDEAEDVEFLSSDNMQSDYAILVDTDNNTILGQVDYRARMNPASMTKVMTVLVAAENVESIKNEVEVTIDATDFAFKNDCSIAGFSSGEVVTVEDLFYGTILSSGGEAAAQLAMYVAGSQDKFVEMMNEKCKELGIADTTHFTNTVGIYSEDHYSTCYDMAVIMNAAVDNEFCKTVLSAKRYTTSSTVEHPEGIQISNWFLRRIEDKDAGGEVLCGKTGYVVQSRNCAVSYMERDDGRHFICVTASAHSAWRAIMDHVDIYKNHTN